MTGAAQSEEGPRPDTGRLDTRRLDIGFTATLVQSPATGGWTYVQMPGSVEYFGTCGLVRVRGRIDG